MSWGLMAGLGRGLNNAAVTLERGMAEDRRARIEAEREKNAEKWRRKAHQLQVDKFNSQSEYQQASLENQQTRAASQEQYQQESLSLRQREADERQRHSIDNAFRQSGAPFDTQIRELKRQRAQLAANADSLIPAEERKAALENIDAQIDILRDRKDFHLLSLYQGRDLPQNTEAYSFVRQMTQRLDQAGLNRPAGVEEAPASSIVADALAGRGQGGEDPAPASVPAEGLMAESPTPQLQEVTLRNLFRKWARNAIPAPLTPEEEQRQREMQQQMQSSGVQSAYGAAHHLRRHNP